MQLGEDAASCQGARRTCGCELGARRRAHCLREAQLETDQRLPSGFARRLRCSGAAEAEIPREQRAYRDGGRVLDRRESGAARLGVASSAPGRLQPAGQIRERGERIGAAQIGRRIGSRRPALLQRGRVVNALLNPIQNVQHRRPPGCPRRGL
jgi:hypothetical protein